MYEIRKAVKSDIPSIRQLAYDTWPKAYGHILSQEQLQYMLDAFYSADSLMKQMEADGHQFILLSESGLPAGFASYSAKKNADPDIFRLHKLYVLPHTQGKGLGRSMIEYILRDISQKGGKLLELNVNRYNNARLFYEKLGFCITREEDIDIGRGFWMNDYVMAKELNEGW